MIKRCTHPGDGWVLAVVNTKQGSKLEQQLGAHRGVAVDTCHEADLGLGRLSLLWLVGDLQSPDGSELHALAQTRQRKEATGCCVSNTRVSHFDIFF